MRLFRPLFCVAICTLLISRTDAAQPVKSNFLVTPVPSQKTVAIAKMRWFVSLTADEYGKIRGKKLNFFQRLSFNLTQHRVKQWLRHYDYGDPTILQKISWLIKGLLIGPIALLLIYIFATEDEQELITWTWIGFAGWCVWVGILVILLLQ
jgi:hypothetical protein